MDPIKLPKSRSEWAGLEWKEAQREVARLLNLNGYLILEEVSIAKGQRSDIIVIRKLQTMTIFGVIEVKCYKNVNRSMQQKSVRQALKYLKSLYNIVDDNPRWGNKPKSYFCAVVFTNDYPSYDSHTIDLYKSSIPKILFEQGLPHLIASTPNSLLKRLANYYPPYRHQASLEEFW